MSDVESTIQKMMAESFSVPVETVKPETMLESLGVDSLGAIEFIFQLEEHFNIRLSEERAPPKTVQDVVDLVEAAIAKQRTLGA